MNVLILGEARRAEELKTKLGDDIRSTHEEKLQESIYATEGLDKFDLIFDLNFDDNPDNLRLFAYHEAKPVVVGAVKKQLGAVVAAFEGEIACKLIGMNTLPTFINRPNLEISFPGSEAPDLALFEQLDWSYQAVKDRVGMVTPRVLFMIINEACYTVEEGTASMEDIDTSMKLGTNYPYGPFEWADKIGIKDVYETLLALKEDTNEERYECSNLLKTKYLAKEPFLN